MCGVHGCLWVCGGVRLCSLVCPVVSRCVRVCAWGCECARVCMSMLCPHVCLCVQVCVCEYAWACSGKCEFVWDEFSEYLLETRDLTSVDFNTYPIRIFSFKYVDCRYATCFKNAY